MGRSCRKSVGASFETMGVYSSPIDFPPLMFFLALFDLLLEAAREEEVKGRASSQIFVEPSLLLLYLYNCKKWMMWVLCSFQIVSLSLYEQKELSWAPSPHRETCKANICLEPVACSDYWRSGWGYWNAWCLPWWRTQGKWGRIMWAWLRIGFHV